MGLLERDAVLASLHEYASSAVLGEGRLILVSGEAGVGKTALVEAFQRATPQLHWLWGACDGLFTPRPLGPLFDIAEQAGGDLLAACGRGAAREDLFGQLLHLARERPTVLVVEDAHWADESTLDLLGYMGRRIRTTTALLIVTYRDDELPRHHPLRVAVGALATERATRRIGLAPLSAGAVAALSRGSRLDPAELFRLTGGNPFFVTEMLAAPAQELPASALAAVQTRVARLSAAAYRTAEIAALLGTVIEPELGREIVGAGPDALDELAASGLLASDGAALRFRHEIIRRAIAEEVPAHRRRQLHERALDALLAAGCVDDARLAYHAEGAEAARVVLDVAPRAARRASALGAHREAAAQYARALRFAADADVSVVAQLHDGVSREAALVDDWARAAAEGERALELWRRVGDAVREGDTLRHLSRAMWRLCRGPESLAFAEHAVEVLEPHGSTPELARAYVVLAGCEMQNAAHADSLRSAQRAVQLTAELELPDVRSDALNTQACLAAATGGDWVPLMQRAVDEAVAAGTVDQAGRAYANMQACYVSERRLAEADEVYRIGSAFCEEQDIATYGYCLAGAYAESLLHQGRWDEAVRISEPMLAGSFTSPANRVGLALTAGAVLARRDDPRASRYLAEARSFTDRADEVDWIVEAYPYLAEAAWLRNDLDAARRDIRVAARHAPYAGAWQAGRIATWCQRLGVPEPHQAARLPEPYAHQLAGDCSAAARAWDLLCSPYDAALALFDTQTEHGLRHALRRFDTLGAAAAVHATRRALRALGVRSIPNGAQPATRAHPHGLTRRQQEVLALICAGQTNAEISARLVISERTVDHHVSAVLAKLGTPTRTAAAQEAARLGLVDALTK